MSQEVSKRLGSVGYNPNAGKAPRWNDFFVVSHNFLLEILKDSNSKAVRSTKFKNMNPLGFGSDSGENGKTIIQIQGIPWQFQRKNHQQT